MYDAAVSVSKTLQNSERMHGFYEAECDTMKPRALSIPSYCEARFGSRTIAGDGVIQVLPVLKRMITRGKLQVFARQNKAAGGLIRLIQSRASGSFHNRAPVIQKLMGPIMAEMHNGEADERQRSRVVPMGEKLQKHIAEFSAEHSELGEPRSFLSWVVWRCMCGPPTSAGKQPPGAIATHIRTIPELLDDVYGCRDHGMFVTLEHVVVLRRSSVTQAVSMTQPEPLTPS